MNNKKHTIANILLGCLILSLMVLHIRYMYHERGDFALGGEWFVYIFAIVAYLRRFVDDY